MRYLHAWPVSSFSFPYGIFRNIKLYILIQDKHTHTHTLTLTHTHTHSHTHTHTHTHTHIYTGNEISCLETYGYHPRIADCSKLFRMKVSDRMCSASPSCHQTDSLVPRFQVWSQWNGVVLKSQMFLRANCQKLCPRYQGNRLWLSACTEIKVGWQSRTMKGSLFGGLRGRSDLSWGLHAVQITRS